MPERVPKAVRLLAEWPITYGPDPLLDAPVERIRDPRFTILILPGPSGQLVEPLDLGDDVAGAVAEVRALLRARGRDRAIWFVPPSVRPSGLGDRLRELGLAPATGPQWEPRYAAMVRLEPPAPGPADVVARRAESFEEFEAAGTLQDDVLDVGDEDRSARAEHRQELWSWQVSGRSPMRTYVGLVGCEIVGSAQALLADAAVNLNGSAVRPEARGRGVYRALVRARWDDAAARGTPALTVQAGAMSRPILERLGFVVLAEQECLLDHPEA